SRRPTVKRQRRPKWMPCVEGLESRLVPASVVTDLPDYAPGSTALITASGYRVGETLQFQVLHTEGDPYSSANHDPWFVRDGGAGDLDGAADGRVQTSWYVD